MEKKQTARGEISGEVVKEMSVIISTGMATKLFICYPFESHHFMSVTIDAIMGAWLALQQPEMNAFKLKNTYRQ